MKHKLTLLAILMLLLVAVSSNSGENGYLKSLRNTMGLLSVPDSTIAEVLSYPIVNLDNSRKLFVISSDGEVGVLVNLDSCKCWDSDTTFNANDLGKKKMK